MGRIDAGAMILLPEYAGIGGVGGRRSSTQRAVVVILQGRRKPEGFECGLDGLAGTVVEWW